MMLNSADYLGREKKRGLVIPTDDLENDSHLTADRSFEITPPVEIPIYITGDEIRLAEDI